MSKYYALLVSLLLLSGCYFKKDTASSALPVYRPLLMARAALEQSVAMLPARELRVPGKTCRQGQYLFISERYEGVHIINNQDPTNPQKVGFLRIPGTLDLSVRGSLLYADNAVDLITVDLSNLSAVRVIGRVRGALPELPLPEAATVEAGYRTEDRPFEAVVIGWQRVQ